jgi:translation initiation factor 4A
MSKNNENRNKSTSGINVDIDEKLIKKLVNTELFDDLWDDDESNKIVESKTILDTKKFKNVLSVSTDNSNLELVNSNSGSKDEIVESQHHNKKTALEILIESRKNPEHTQDILKDDEYYKKVESLTKEGELFLKDLKKSGIHVTGITGSMIIQNWEDIKYIDCNPNIKYLNSLIDSIIGYGFEVPRAIQSVTIGRIALGRDIIVQAQAGNGKTCAFGVGACLRINPNLHETQIIILSPTRLLTDQIKKVLCDLLSKTEITIDCHRGGMQTVRNGRKAKFVVACPGRLCDMIKNGNINLNYVKTIILDEGDELLKLGFRDQVKKIIECLSESVQICLFSATVPRGILELCKDVLVDPAYVILPESNVITNLISQWYIKCTNHNQKDGSIVDIIKTNPKETIIIFFNSCSRLIKVSEILNKHLSTTHHLCIYGRMDESDKKKSIKDFTDGKYKLLLASDLAARGIDIPSVSIVINYDVPTSIDTYVHRIGRAGRGNLYGNAVTLSGSQDDYDTIRRIVTIHSMPIKALKSTILNSYPVNQ